MVCTFIVLQGFKNKNELRDSLVSLSETRFRKPLLYPTEL